MEENKKTNQVNVPTLWADLSDNQKAKILIDSSRLPDEEQFINRYGSWEYPDPEKVYLERIES